MFSDHTLAATQTGKLNVRYVKLVTIHHHPSNLKEHPLASCYLVQNRIIIIDSRWILFQGGINRPPHISIKLERVSTS